ncbi:MAG: MarR family transcriptional regulator [Dehalococcoidales bacterium]
MDSLPDEKEKKFDLILNKLTVFTGEMLSEGHILLESEGNLTMSQLRVLLLLKINHKMNMTQIASALNIHVSTATGLIDRLIVKRYIKRESDCEDRRIIYCTLTEDGFKIADNIWRVVLENAQSLVEFVSSEELDVIGNSIDILQRAWAQRRETLNNA